MPRDYSGWARARVIRRLASILADCRLRRSLSLTDLAREHGCCERTIRRDLEAIEAAGLYVPTWRAAEKRDVAA